MTDLLRLSRQRRFVISVAQDDRDDRHCRA
jgi:hypothetical protein